MAKLSPVFNDQTFDANGNPAVGYKLFTYAAGSSTKQTAYTDSAGTVAHPNPIILNASGYPTTGPIWLTTGQNYKFVLASSTDTDPPTSPLKTIDNVSGVNDSSSTNTQWVSAGVTPTYVSATSFTLPGDQTAEFHARRRLQFSTTAGTVYGTISTSVYGALTTVTVVMDSGALDAGLSNVNLSILRADNLAVPGFIGASRVQGLIGAPNAATPLTKYDLSADSVTLRNASGGTVVRYNTGTLTCDLGLAGITANGRDQVAAFPINSWVHIYKIWNGTTLALIASLAAPNVGPALPTGYTHWCYATTIRWNASSNILPGTVRGNTFIYDATIGALTAGQSTSLTAVALASAVPPNTVRAKLQCILNVTHNAASVEFAAYLRTTGAGGAGVFAVDATTQVANIPLTAEALVDWPVNSSQQIDYKINNAPSTSGGAYINVYGYTVSNGDA